MNMAWTIHDLKWDIGTEIAAITPFILDIDAGPRAVFIVKSKSETTKAE